MTVNICRYLLSAEASVPIILFSYFASFHNSHIIRRFPCVDFSHNMGVMKIFLLDIPSIQAGSENGFIFSISTSLLLRGLVCLEVALFVSRRPGKLPKQFPVCLTVCKLTQKLCLVGLVNSHADYVCQLVRFIRQANSS